MRKQSVIKEYKVMLQRCRIWLVTLAKVTISWWTHRLVRTIQTTTVAPIAASQESEESALIEAQEHVEMPVVHVVPRVPRLRSERVTQQPRSPRWEFKRDILERLDEYFYCIRRMRKHDPGNYDLLSRTGLTIPAGCYINPDRQAALGRIETTQRPAFGGVLVGGGEDPESVYPSFLYFSKVIHPGRVQWAHGDVYALTALYDNRKERHRKLILPCTCHVVISPTGETSLLREAVSVTNTVHRKAGRRKEKLSLTQVQWRYPAWVCEIPEEKTRKHTTPEEFARFLMSLALETYSEAHARTTIRVRQQSDVAAFGIDLSRCPRFFADRDATALAVDGKRKRIFHSVVQHARRLSDKSVEVKAHYRGLRLFDWNSYQVVIVWPKTDLRTFDAPAVYEQDITEHERQQLLSPRETGERLAELLDQ